MVALFSGIVTGLLAGAAALLLMWGAAKLVVWASRKPRKAGRHQHMKEEASK